jgi:hypothetical protein
MNARIIPRGSLREISQQGGQAPQFRRWEYLSLQMLSRLCRHPRSDTEVANKFLGQRRRSFVLDHPPFSKGGLQGGHRATTH